MYSKKKKLHYVQRFVPTTAMKVCQVTTKFS